VAAEMDAVNPIYIPRNHKVEEALAAATDNDDLAPMRTMLDVLARPFTERPGFEALAKPAPESFGRYRTFCGT
jgi:serine/tyrosine/threonine adenylyltransferase